MNKNQTTKNELRVVDRVLAENIIIGFVVGTAFGFGLCLFLILLHVI
jgi:hypothetical protein